MPPASVGADRRTDATCREPAITSVRDHSRRIQLLAAIVTMLLFAGGAALARAEGPPHPATPAPTSTTTSPPPAPPGAFGWEIAGNQRTAGVKPPAPPASSSIITTAPAPARVVTATTAAVQKPRPAHRLKPARTKKTPPATTTRVVRPRRTGAVLAAHTTGRPGGAYASVLMVATLSLAIACFALGSMPAPRVRWRRGAAFVADRRLDVTVAGFLSLLAAAVVYALVGGR
jgi:hypothetical protein